MSLIMPCKPYGSGPVSSVLPEKAIQHGRRFAHAKAKGAPAVQGVRSSKREQTLGREEGAGRQTDGRVCTRHCRMGLRSRKRLPSPAKLARDFVASINRFVSRGYDFDLQYGRRSFLLVSDGCSVD